MLDIIQQYVQQGFRVFPLRGKKPAVKEGEDWKLIPKDPTLSRSDIPKNFGVHTENRLVIDIDIKDGAKGKESFAQLCGDLKLEKGWESKTFVVKTGSGGFHIYLNFPLGVETSLYLKEYPGLEFRHGPFYVVGAESIHPDTKKRYEVVFGSLNALLDAPGALVARIVKQERVTIGPAPEPGFVDDDALNIERFKESLSGMPEATTGARRNSLYVAACRGRDFGLSECTCLQTLKESYLPQKISPALSDPDIEHTVRSAYTYAKEKAGHLNVGAIFKVAEVGEKINFGDVKYDLTAKGAIKPSLNNAVNYLVTLPKIQDAFRYNTFSGMIEINSSAPWYKERGAKGPNLCDEDVVLLKFFLAKTISIEFSQQTVLEAVIVVAHKRHYHPIRNYLQSLVWDQIPRLNNWLTVFGHAIDTSYTRAIARKTLCAAVKRVMEPGCKWDHVLIIEGDQGIGKSTACRILGRNWGGDMNLDPHAKDAIHMMLSKWVIELSEMTALRWHDANSLKSFITREKDTVRLSYERHAKDFPRQSIFIGTVNPEHVGYLNDITGNRRYWITRFNGPVDLKGLENNCDQLWAEAFQCYKNEMLYLVGEAEQLQVLEAQARMPEDPMRQNVVRWVKENPEVNEVTTEEILEYVGVPMKSVTRADQSRVAAALVGLRWDKKISREGGVFSTSYTRPMREQMNQIVGEL